MGKAKHLFTPVGSARLAPAAQSTTDPRFLCWECLVRGEPAYTALLLQAASLRGCGSCCRVGVPGAAYLVCTFCPNSRCCLPGMIVLDFTSDGEALRGVRLGEVPSPVSFRRAPRKAWGVVPSLGMMPSDEGGSETESLYEIEGMNKWILYL